VGPRGPAQNPFASTELVAQWLTGDVNPNLGKYVAVGSDTTFEATEADVAGLGKLIGPARRSLIAEMCTR
jgi:hypothetical protein